MSWDLLAKIDLSSETIRLSLAGTATASRQQDMLLYDFSMPVQPFTAYMKFVEMGGKYSGNNRQLWALQAYPSQSPQAHLYSGTSPAYVLRINDADLDGLGYPSVSGASLLSGVEIVCQLLPTQDCYIEAHENGVLLSSLYGAQNANFDYAGTYTRLTVASANVGGSRIAILPVQEFALARGVKTIDEMRRLVR